MLAIYKDCNSYKNKDIDVFLDFPEEEFDYSPIQEDGYKVTFHKLDQEGSEEELLLTPIG